MQDHVIDLWNGLAKTLIALLLVLITVVIIVCLLAAALIDNTNSIIKGQDEAKERGCAVLAGQNQFPESCEGVGAP